MKGRLKDRPLELLTHEIQSRSQSGVLTLDRAPVKKQLCFVKGTLRFAASNVREDRLAEFLIRSGILPEETVRQAEQSTPQGRRLSEHLLSSRVLAPDAMRDIVRAHALDIVLPCLEWRTGEYRFEEGAPNIVGEVATEILPLEIVLERARRSLVPAMLQDLEKRVGSVLSVSGHAARDVKRLRLTPAEAVVLARAEEGDSLGGALAVSPSLRGEFAKAAGAMLACGILSLVAPTSDRKGSVYDTIPPSGKKKEQPPPSIAGEVRYYRQMYDILLGADHYRTLGVDTRATAEEVRRAYYTLAKEIHPDRFLSPPLDVLHQNMEELFAQVLSAYNTLSNPDTRARYDAERASTGAAPKIPATDQQALAKQNYLRGRALFEDGKMAEALKFLQNAVELDGNRAEYLRLLGNVQARNPRMRLDAEASFLRAIELDPARAEGYLQLGLLYRRMGEVERSIERLRECLKWDPANIEAGTALAELTRAVGSTS